MNLSRILIALDSSNSSTGLLSVAAELALGADAELRAMFIEDKEWFEVSQISFVKQVSSYTGDVIPLSEKHISEQSRALRSLLQEMFSNIGQSLNIKYNYQSVRGVVTQELLDAAKNVDLVMVGRSGRSLGSKNKLGSTARELAEKSKTPVLIWNSGNQWPQSFIGLCTLPASSMEVIDWTIRLADILDCRPHLFWPPDTVINSEAWEVKKIPFERARSVSQVFEDYSAEGLKYYRNELLVISRNNLTQNTGEYLESLPNSVLFL